MLPPPHAAKSPCPPPSTTETTITFESETSGDRLTMGESSIGGGALVPSAVSKSEPEDSIAPSEVVDVAATADLDLDKDVMCPICMQIIKDAFLTACGHTFCYMCISTHLRNKSDCPCCSQYLTSSRIFPNFLLNKLLKKASASQISKNTSLVENFRLAIQQGCEVSAKEIDKLLSLLTDKKRKMEQEEAETKMQILLDFLHCLRKQKAEELKEIQTDLQYISEDINAVERRRIELHKEKDRYLMKPKMLIDDPTTAKPFSPLIDKHNSIPYGAWPGQSWMHSSSRQNNNTDVKGQASSQGFRGRDACGASDSQFAAQSSLSVARKCRVHAKFNDLQEFYLQRRRQGTRQLNKQKAKEPYRFRQDGYNPGLDDFQSVLTSLTQYSRLRVIAELRHGDIFHPVNIVSSIEFDRDDELFATAGVSRRIKVFELSSVVNEPADIHLPIVTMSTRSKLACLSWNKFTKNLIASSDYDGIVTVWDVTTRQSLMEYEEHEKRAWSVDFSCTDPSMLVSGSHDGKVKVWCTNQEASVIDIDVKANVCSVKYNPGSSYHVAVGSVDRKIHYFDLRNTSQPLYVFSGHKKAVSFVKFLSNNELASASTDSTLRLWDVRENLPLRTFRGHKNETSFVGLTVNSDYIACGSETNEVFVYHKAISRPAVSHSFVSDAADDDNDSSSYHISAVCWKRDSPTLLAANRQGTIKVLVLAA